MKTFHLSYLGKYLLTFVLLFTGLTTFSQSVDEDVYYKDRLIFTLNDKNLSPEEVKNGMAKRLADLLETFNVVEYRQAYPTSRREQLLKRYLVICEDCDIIQLKTQLESALSKSISAIDLLPKPIFMGNGNVASEPDFLKSFSTSCSSPYYPQEFPVNHPNWRMDLRTTNVPCAWSITRGSSSVKVAVLDTDFNVDHPDLNIVFQHPNITTVTTGSGDGHGTRSAGAVATKHNNGWICNVAGNDIANGGGVGLMLYPTGFGAILEAAQDGADIISNSWGFCASTLSPTQLNNFQMIIDEATEDYNAIVIAGAGNAGGSGTIHWSFCGGMMEIVPAALDNVISVTGVHQTKMLFSDPPGSTTPFGHHNFHPTIDICAPAYGNTTTCNDTAQSSCNDYGTGFATGQGWHTSIACPFTAGIVALMLSENPHLTHDEVEAILKKTAQPIDDYCLEPYVGLIGAGYVDAYEAVLAAQHVGQTNESPAQIITYSSATLCEEGKVTLCANKDYVATNWLLGGSGPGGTYLGSTKCIEVTTPGDYSLYAVNSKNFTLVQTVEITDGTCCSNYCPPTYVDEDVILDKSDFTELHNDDFTSNYNVGMYLPCDSKWQWGGEGSIAFAKDIKQYNYGQWDGIDHTNGETSFIIGDASTIADTRAFYITQPVDIVEKYTFSAWVRNIYDPHPSFAGNIPTIELRVETSDGTVTTLASSGPLDFDDGWVEICGTYDPTSIETVEFQIVSLQVSPGTGFDFGVDDIRLVRSFEYPDISICEGECFDMGYVYNPSYNYSIYYKNASTNGVWQTLCVNCGSYPYTDCPTITTDYIVSVWNPDNFCSAYELFKVTVLPQGHIQCTFGPPGSGLVEDNSAITDFAMDVAVFPNPVKSSQSVTVEVITTVESDGYIELLNTSGKTILKKKYHFNSGVNSDLISLEANALSKGVYFIQVFAGDSQKTQKLYID